jgi:hypothetical protein
LNHMPVTFEFKKTLTRKAESWGIDINDPKYHYNTMDWMATGFSFNEDYAQNFPHAVLLVIATIAFLCRKSLYSKPRTVYNLYFFTLAGTALLFTILLKWQPWSNRLETALFMLFSIFLAMEIGNWNKWLRFLCVIPTVIYGVIALLQSTNHPLLPVSQSIFKKPYSYFMYADQVFDCKAFFDSTSYTKIGIAIGADSPDYYYYKLLSESSSAKRRELNHVMVSNSSSIYPDNFMPEAIIYSGVGPPRLNYKGKEFVHKRTFREKLWIYVAR